MTDPKDTPPDDVVIATASAIIDTTIVAADLILDYADQVIKNSTAGDLIDPKGSAPDNGGSHGQSSGSNETGSSGGGDMIEDTTDDASNGGGSKWVR